MRICLVCSEYPPSRHGGIGSFIRMFARSLIRNGHKVRVVGIYAEVDSSPETQEDDGVEVWRIRSPGGKGRWIAARYELFRKISEWAHRGEIDLVEVPDYGGIAAAWPRLPLPVVVRLHGSGTYFAAEMGWRPDWKMQLWERWSLRRADYCCSTSQYTASRTTQLFPGVVSAETVLHNFIETEACPGSRLRNPVKVIYTGTLTPKKGVIALVDAWPQVQARFLNAELHLCGGDGRMESGRLVSSYIQANLGRWIDKTVFLHGFIPREEVLEMLSTSRCAVFPSFSEAFALAPLEAMSLGCATIYTRLASGPELIEDGRTGLLVDPHDPGEISKAILRIIGDDALASSIAAEGRRYVHNNLSAEVMTARNEEFYRKCVDRFKRTPNGTWQRRMARCLPEM